jgi:hypothetical protein
MTWRQSFSARLAARPPLEAFLERLTLTGGLYATGKESSRI